MIHGIGEVMHVGSYDIFVKTQVRNDLLLCKENWKTVLFLQYLVRLLFLENSHFLFHHHDTDPDKVVCLILCELVKVGVQ